MIEPARPTSAKESPQNTTNILSSTILKVTSQETRKSSIPWRNLSSSGARWMPLLTDFMQYGALIDDAK